LCGGRRQFWAGMRNGCRICKDRLFSQLDERMCARVRLLLGVPAAFLPGGRLGFTRIRYAADDNGTTLITW
jgi:hypothetical protein